MKKAGSILCVLLLLCSIFSMAVPVSAANTVSIGLHASKESVSVGDTVEVTVSLSSGSNLGTLQFILQYDSACVELVESKSSAQGVFDWSQPNWHLSSDKIRYVGVTPGAVTAGGTILKATFTVKKANPQFSLTVESATDGNDSEVPYTVSSPLKLKCSHRYGDWTVTQQPTCQVAGKKERTCVDCGAKDTATIAVSAHTPSAWETVRQPACTDAGERVQKCTVCSAVCKRESIAALGHNIPAAAWNVTKEATCDAAGERTAACTRCGKTESEKIPALGHDIPASAWKVTKEATCDATGERTAACTRCGKTVSESIPALGHDIPKNAWTVTKEPTCEATGTHTASCTRCGKTVSESIPALGHDIPASAWKVTKEPDCETAGIHTAACTRCGKTVTEEIAPIGHSVPDSAWSVITEATCETTGERQGVCSVCGKSVTEEIPLRDHDYGEWQIVREATETECGEKERVCKICGAKETETIEPITAVETVAEPEEPRKQMPQWAVAAGIGAGIFVVLCAAAGVWVFIVKKKAI